MFSFSNSNFWGLIWSPSTRISVSTAAIAASEGLCWLRGNPKVTWAQERIRSHSWRNGRRWDLWRRWNCWFCSAPCQAFSSFVRSWATTRAPSTCPYNWRSLADFSTVSPHHSLWSGRRPYSRSRSCSWPSERSSDSTSNYSISTLSYQAAKHSNYMRFRETYLARSFYSILVVTGVVLFWLWERLFVGWRCRGILWGLISARWRLLVR